MPAVDILQYPSKRLKRKGVPVTDFGPEFQTVIDTMCDTYRAAENCAALAATQLDLEPAPHVTVINYDHDNENLLCLVNGKIVEREGEQNEEEGCMSVGCDIDIRVYARVKRAYRVKVEGQDRYGEPLTLEAEGYMAKCLQHELDHLDGIIYLDHLSSLKRKMIETKLSKELKKQRQEKADKPIKRQK